MTPTPESIKKAEVFIEEEMFESGSEDSAIKSVTAYEVRAKFIVTLALALDAARREEREECAKVADDFEQQSRVIAISMAKERMTGARDIAEGQANRSRSISTAIRARGEVQP